MCEKLSKPLRRHLSEGDGKVPETLLEGVLERAYRLKVKKFKGMAEEIDDDAFDLDDLEDVAYAALATVLRRLREIEGEQS